MPGDENEYSLIVPTRDVSAGERAVIVLSATQSYHQLPARAERIRIQGSTKRSSRALRAERLTAVRRLPDTLA
jgi:hypothetical protein